MTNKIVIWLAAMTLALISISCIGTGDPMEDFVVTRLDNIEDEVRNADYTGVPQAERPFIVVNVEDLSKDLLVIVQAVMPEVTQVVFTERQFLKEEYRSTADITQVINLSVAHLNPDTGEVEVNAPAMVSTIGGIASAIFPEIVPFLPIIGLIPWLRRKRSRKHLVEATKKAVPMDGTIDIAGAFASTAKAFGWTHSTSDPAELEQIANEIKVKEAAANGNLSVLTEALEAKGKVS